jgi:hypothetical protein
MKLTADINEVNEILANYKGGQCHIAYFSQGFTRLAILVQISGQDEVVFLTGVNCSFIQGPFHFPCNSLVIEKDPSSGITSIYEKSSGFLLKAGGGIALVKGRIEQFGESLDDFITDKSELPD